MVDTTLANAFSGEIAMIDLTEDACIALQDLDVAGKAMVDVDVEMVAPPEHSQEPGGTTVDAPLLPSSTVASRPPTGTGHFLGIDLLNLHSNIKSWNVFQLPAKMPASTSSNEPSTTEDEDEGPKPLSQIEQDELLARMLAGTAGRRTRRMDYSKSFEDFEMEDVEYIKTEKDGKGDVAANEKDDDVVMDSEHECSIESTIVVKSSPPKKKTIKKEKSTEALKTAAPAKRGVGKPPAKHKRTVVIDDESDDDSDFDNMAAKRKAEKQKQTSAMLAKENQNPNVPPKRGRGRPKKDPAELVMTQRKLARENQDPSTRRGPGRPRKNPVQIEKDIISPARPRVSLSSKPTNVYLSSPSRGADNESLRDYLQSSPTSRYSFRSRARDNPVIRAIVVKKRPATGLFDTTIKYSEIPIPFSFVILIVPRFNHPTGVDQSTRFILAKDHLTDLTIQVGEGFIENAVAQKAIIDYETSPKLYISDWGFQELQYLYAQINLRDWSVYGDDTKSELMGEAIFEVLENWAATFFHKESAPGYDVYHLYAMVEAVMFFLHTEEAWINVPNSRGRLHCFMRVICMAHMEVMARLYYDCEDLLVPNSKLQNLEVFMGMMCEFARHWTVNLEGLVGFNGDEFFHMLYYIAQEVEIDMMFLNHEGLVSVPYQENSLAYNTLEGHWEYIKYEKAFKTYRMRYRKEGPGHPYGFIGGDLYVVPAQHREQV